ALAAITRAVAQMRDSNTQIAVAAEQQSQVAEEMTRSVIGIRDVTERTVEQTVNSAATSDELAALAGELTRAIGQLKLGFTRRAAGVFTPCRPARLPSPVNGHRLPAHGNQLALGVPQAGGDMPVAVARMLDVRAVQAPV